MADIVERLRIGRETCGVDMCRTREARSGCTCAEAADEIERLREALRHYVSECDCNGGTYHEDDHITGKTLVKDCPKCEPARTALGEKE